MFHPNRFSLACGTAAVSVMVPVQAQAQQRDFNIPAQNANRAFTEFAQQAQVKIVAPGESLRGVRTRPVRGRIDVAEALAKLLDGTKLTASRNSSGVYIVKRVQLASAPEPAIADDGELQGRRTAQGVSNGQAASTEAHSEGQVEEIVVTANKRAENIQNVPITITAVNGERLESIGVTNTQDLARVVPGVQVQMTAGGGTNVHLRGVGTTSVTEGAENSVATYVDNVYILSLSGALVQLNNIQQIEVLKGPQGTLFGRNATGGVINIRTRDPRHEPGGELTVSYGNYDTVSGKAYLTAGIAENLAADIAGFVSLQGDGWGKNLFNGKDANRVDEYAVRSKWLFEPGDRDQFRLIGDYSVQKGNRVVSSAPLKGTATNYGPGDITAADRAARVGLDGNPTTDALAFQGLINAFIASGGALGLAPFAVVGDPYVFEGGFFDIDTAIQPHYKLRNGGASLQWDHDFDGLKLTSITAYRRTLQSLISSNQPVPAFRGVVDWHTRDTQFSQELQLSSANGARIPWVAGLYYLKGKGGYLQFHIRGTPLTPLDTLGFRSFVSTESGAAFGQVTVPLWSGSHLTGGLRYTIEQRAVEGETILEFLPEFGGATLVTGATKAHKTFRKLTWRIALDQQLTADILGYASYNRGFKSGVFNSVPASGDPIEPEVLDAFEIGLKTDLLDRKLRLNVAAFYYDYKNIQVSILTPVTAILDNGAGARAYGLDIDLTAKIGRHFTLFGGANLMHSEFTSYPEAGFFVPQPASAGGGTVGSIGSAKGNKLPYAPDLSFNVGGNYTAPIGDGEMSLNINYNYSGKWFAGPDNILSQGAYSLVDGSATYTFPGDQLNIGIWARNITNERYHAYLAAGGNPGGQQGGIGGAPRTYGVKAGYKF